MGSLLTVDPVAWFHPKMCFASPLHRLLLKNVLDLSAECCYAAIENRCTLLSILISEARDWTASSLRSQANCDSDFSGLQTLGFSLATEQCGSRPLVIPQWGWLLLPWLLFPLAVMMVFLVKALVTVIEMLWGKITLRGAQIARYRISACPPGWGVPVESCPAETTGYVGH